MSTRVADAIPAVFEEIVDADTPAFRTFYAMYEAAFPLADEREPPEAFEAILALNANLTLQRAHGPYREMVAAIYAWDGGPMIGGHVFGMTTSAAHRADGIAASVQGIYTFLHPDMRGTLPIWQVAEYSQRTAARIFAPAGFVQRLAPPILLEVNNPLRMSDDEIALDTRISGTDPFRRYMFWRRSGFRPLDFPYVQPALRADASAIAYLDLFCSDGVGRLPSALLLEHLNAFISVSCLKGEDASRDPYFAAMKEWLKAREYVDYKATHSGEVQAITDRIRTHSRRA